MDRHSGDLFEGEDELAPAWEPSARPAPEDPNDRAALIDHLPGVVYRCDAEPPWRIRYVSPQTLELTGYPAADFLSGAARWRDLIHPDDFRATEARREAELAATGGCVLQYRIRRRDGAISWVVEHSKLVRQRDGQPALEGYVYDNTAQKQTEFALRAGRAQLSTMFEQALVGILHRDGRGHIVSVNDTLCRMLGRTPEDLSGVPLADIFYPEDVEETIRNYAEHAATGTPFTTERRFRRPDGSTIWCEAQVHFVRDEEGEIESSISLLLDITERRRMDEQRAQAMNMLHMALQGADAGLFELDLNDFSLRLSPEARRIYGLPADHGEYLSHEGWRALIHPEDLALPPPVSSDPDSPHKPVALEFRVRDADGRVRWLRCLSHGIPETKGEMTKIAGLVFDDTERKLAEQKLQASEEHLRLVQEAAQIGTYAMGNDRVAFGSQQFFRTLGLDENRTYLTEAEYLTIVHPEDRAKIARDGRYILATDEEGLDSEFRIVRPDTGEVRWTFNRTRYLRDAEGRINGAVGAQMDITGRKRAEEAARAGEALNLSITEASADGIALLDMDGRVTFMNRHALAAAGRSTIAALAGRPWAECWPGEVHAPLARAIEDARAHGVGRFTGSTPADGNDVWWDVAITPVPGEGGGPSALLAISRDVTEQRRTVERVRWAAGHDAMTGLPNRRVFHEQLQDTLEEARDHGGRVGLLILDIDHFKEVNDDKGHDAGDALLRIFSERLRSAVRSTDTVARLGGDEFAVILRHLSSEDDIAKIVPPILERLQVPFTYLGQSLDCRASVGAATYPDQGLTPDELMKNADLALYAAKLSHRGSVTMFASNMRSEMQNRLSMLNLARDAIKQGLILPFYQPKVHLDSGRLAGFEALLRWRHASLGVQLPASIAEAFGDVELAIQIGGQMQERVLGDMRRWLDRGLAFHHVAINTSAAEFRKDDFAEQLLERIHRARVPREMIEVEITERTAFLGKNSEYVVRALEVLRANHVRVALDDFGTGFSSLSHLKELPVDVLKIDQSFVRDIAGTPDSDDAAIVLAVLNLGKSLGIEVVAEGIEELSQADFLRAHGCDTGQGYLFGKAVPASQVPALIESRRRAGLAA